MNHLEGGWPRDIDYTDAEHTIRYRKKARQAEKSWCFGTLECGKGEVALLNTAEATEADVPVITEIRILRNLDYAATAE